MTEDQAWHIAIVAALVVLLKPLYDKLAGTAEKKRDEPGDDPRL